jgi:hypothetical protein
MIMVLDLVYNEETQEWEQKPEPFITIECETEEDFEFIGTAVAFYKKHLEEQEKPQTKADRIRAMSDEELAKWLCSISTAECCDRSCPARDICDYNDNGMIKWLKQHAEVEHG